MTALLQRLIQSKVDQKASHLNLNPKGPHFQMLLILALIFGLGQPLSGQETRKITGTVQIEGEPLIGQSIREEGTRNGTTTQLNGEFELMIPKREAVLLHLSQCFTQGYVIITPEMDHVDIQLDKKFFRKSKRAYRRWKRLQSKSTNQNPVGNYFSQDKKRTSTVRLEDSGWFELTTELRYKVDDSPSKCFLQEGFWKLRKDTIELHAIGQTVSSGPTCIFKPSYYRIEIKERYLDSIKGVRFEFLDENHQPIDYLAVSLNEQREKRDICGLGLHSEYLLPDQWTEVDSILYFYTYRTGGTDQELDRYEPIDKESNHFVIQAFPVHNIRDKQVLPSRTSHLLYATNKVFSSIYHWGWDPVERKYQKELAGFNFDRPLKKKE